MKTVCRFYPCELPAKLRQTVAPFCRLAWTDDTDATRIASQSGFPTPLDPFTPPGIVADWLRDNDDGSTDCRLLVRMLDAVQHAYETDTPPPPYDGVTIALKGGHPYSVVMVPAVNGIMYDLSKFPWPTL